MIDLVTRLVFENAVPAEEILERIFHNGSLDSVEWIWVERTEWSGLGGVDWVELTGWSGLSGVDSVSGLSGVDRVEWMKWTGRSGLGGVD